jgi:hypothetical protein
VTGGPVETFLEELGRYLRRDDATRQRVVAEVGDHLRDLIAEGRARGLDEHAAELEAIDRFGSARAFARGVRPARRRTRAVWLGSAAAVVAVACGGLAFAELRNGSSHTATPVAVPPVRAATDDPSGCFAAVTADRAVQAMAVRMMHPDAVDSQVLVEIGTRIKIDPRTGRVLCRAAGANGRNKTIWFVTSNTKAPFG